jgi:hypothetical protein
MRNGAGKFNLPCHKLATSYLWQGKLVYISYLCNHPLAAFEFGGRACVAWVCDGLGLDPYTAHLHSSNVVFSYLHVRNLTAVLAGIIDNYNV